jgi:phosphatidylglycerol:prolipoprotein diacylglycerol transferase
MATYVHDLDPVIWRITDAIQLRWYGLAYLMGFVAGFWLLRNLAQRKLFVLEREKVGDFIAATALFGVFLGGRLGYVLFYQLPEVGWGRLLEDPLMLLRVWEGGMASHGGILGVAIFLWFYAKKHQVTWTGLGDGISVVAPLGLMFGRLANFINGELYGRAAGEGVPWAMKFPMSLAEEGRDVQDAAWQACVEVEPRLAQAAGIGDLGQLVHVARENEEVSRTLGEFLTARHPSQLYEAALEGLVLFLILWIVRVRFRNAPDGFLTGLFFVLYALFRIVCEQFREPDAEMVGLLTRGQFLSVFMFVFAAAFLAHAWRGWKKRTRG